MWQLIFFLRLLLTLSLPEFIKKFDNCTRENLVRYVENVH